METDSWPVQLQRGYEEEGALYNRQVCWARSSFTCCRQTGILADDLSMFLLCWSGSHILIPNVIFPQEVPEKSKDSPGGPWQFVGLLPLFDPPRHDSAETIRKALVLGVNVKMITGTYPVTTKWSWNQLCQYFHECLTWTSFCTSGDQLAIGKETGRRLGMGTNMYPSSSLLGQNKDSTLEALPVDELIEKADGFAGVFPGAPNT